MNKILPAPTIFISNAFLSYDGIVLFDKLNLTLSPGKFTCLLGPSGVGKTTLLRLIANLIPPSHSNHEIFQGSISCDNQKPVSDQVAYLAQNDLLLPWFDALNNAMLGARLRGNESIELESQAKKLFHQVGLSKATHKYPRQLSGGMRQRVALVRTLLENKPIVLMDEPFSSLDAITRFELQTLTAKLLKNRTVFLVTHDPLEAVRLADEIYILSGQPATLKLSTRLLSTTPRDPSDPAVMEHQAELFHALIRAKEK